MSINELQDEVVAEFSDFDDWMDRYQLLIDLGNEQEPLDEKYKTEQNLIEGCQSRVWLQADEVDGKIIFKAESDALIVKGIIALLIKVVSGHTPDEILNSELYLRRPESGSRTSPVSFWMSFSSGRSSSEQNAIAVPSCPARPVRPMRCT